MRSRESRAATEAAQKTANVTAAAAGEYVRWRHQDYLRAIARYVADIAMLGRDIESTALAHAEAGNTSWRSPTQAHLDISMKGTRIPLPRCHDLAQPFGPALLGAADDERASLVARAAMEAAREVGQRPELYAPVINPLANVQASAAAMSASDRRPGKATT